MIKIDLGINQHVDRNTINRHSFWMDVFEYKNGKVETPFTCNLNFMACSNIKSIKILYYLITVQYLWKDGKIDH